MLELDLRVKLAERAAAVELAEDEDEFVGALMKELRSWDVYLERLQVKVATTAGDGRNQGEAAIRELRRRRNTLGAHLGETTSTSGTAWRRVREHVKVTRNELKSGAAELEARFAGGTENDGQRLVP